MDSFVLYLPDIKSAIEDGWEEIEAELKAGPAQKEKAGSGNLRLVSFGEKTKSRDTRETGPRAAEPEKGEDAGNVFVLRISLIDIKPQIWRRVEVPISISLGELHRIIRIVMGWRDSRPHSFMIEGFLYGQAEDAVSLEDLDLREKDRFLYVCGPGNIWEYQILVSRIQAPAGDCPRPRCLGGRRACPPEECGGPRAYAELFGASGTPGTKKGRKAPKWAEDFDPEYFDADSVNESLAAWEGDDFNAD
jgi:hypothetical protein